MTYIAVSSSEDIARVDDVAATVPAVVVFLEITISQLSGLDISRQVYPPGLCSPS